MGSSRFITSRRDCLMGDRRCRSSRQIDRVTTTGAHAGPERDCLRSARRPSGEDRGRETSRCSLNPEMGGDRPITHALHRLRISKFALVRTTCAIVPEGPQPS